MGVTGCTAWGGLGLELRQMHPARIILRQQEGRTVWLEAQGCVLSLPP